MIVKEDDENRCMTFADFCFKLDNDDFFKAWFDPMFDDFEDSFSCVRLGDGSPQYMQRLRAVQRELVDLIMDLDPKSIALPGEDLKKLDMYVDAFLTHTHMLMSSADLLLK